MKQLIGITAAGAAAVLLFAFLAKAAFNVLHGQPIAHVSGIWAVVLRNSLTVLVMLLCFAGYAVWWWIDDRIRNPRWPR